MALRPHPAVWVTGVDHTAHSASDEPGESSGLPRGSLADDI